MSIATKPFEQLGELYLGTLVSDAYHQGFAGTIVDAINGWHGVLEIIQPDQQSQLRSHQVNAACTLTHHAMGLYCAGKVFARADWQEQARDFLHQVVDAQSADGWWAEHKGPVVAYNLVYAE